MSGHNALLASAGRCTPLLQTVRSINVTGSAANDPGVVIHTDVQLNHSILVYGNGFLNVPTQTIALPKLIPGGFTEDNDAPTSPCSSAMWAVRMLANTALSTDYGFNSPLNTWFSLSDEGGGGAGPYEWAWNRTVAGTSVISAQLQMGLNAVRAPMLQTNFTITLTAT